MTFSQNSTNQLFSPLRVVLEHARSGSKRLAQDKVRGRGDCFRDTVVVVACGLRNRCGLSAHRASLAR